MLTEICETVSYHWYSKLNGNLLHALLPSMVVHQQTTSHWLLWNDSQVIPWNQAMKCYNYIDLVRDVEINRLEKTLKSNAVI